MTKFALLAAASATALAFAGAAQAGNISGSVNAVAVTNTGGVTAPYNIATEFVDPSVAAPDNSAATGANAFVLTNTLSNVITVAGGSVQNYQVTFDVAGGTIPTTNAAALAVAGTANGGSFTVAQGARTANSVSFIVTVTGVGGTGYVINGFTLTTGARSTSETNITAGGSVALLAGGVTTVVDTAPVVTVVRYGARLGTFSVTSNTVTAALPSFSLFQGATSTANLSNQVGATTTYRTAQLATDYTLSSGAGTFYAGLTGAAVTVADIIAGGSVTVTGANLVAGLSPTLVNTAPSNTVFAGGNSVTYTLDDANADLFVGGTADFTVTEDATAANRIALSGGSYSTTFTPTYATNFSGPTTFSAASGTIRLDGTNFIAPWVGGSQAATKSVIRLSNGGSAASGTVTLRLNNALARAAGVTTGPGAAIANQTCAQTFTIPSTGDLQIGQGELAACFGAFLRGDVQITVQSTATALTAKMRQVEADGTTYESSLGRFSGATATDAAF